MEKVKTTMILSYEIKNYGLGKEVINRVLGDLFRQYGYEFTAKYSYLIIFEGKNLDESIIEENLRTAENKLLGLAKLQASLKTLGY